jgi:hypothetical protein
MTFDNLLLNGIAYCLVNFAFLIVGSFLNVVVALSIWKSTQLRKKLSYFMIFMLSCNDLVVVIVLHPSAIYRYVLLVRKEVDMHSQQFALFFYISNILFGCSLFGVFTMTLERYLGLAYPIFHKTSVTKRRLVIFLLAAQTFGLIWHTVTFSLQTSTIQQAYTLLFVSVFVILVMVLNFKMFYIAKTSRHHTASSNSKRKFFEYKKYHTCLLTIVLMFLCCCPVFAYYGLVVFNMLDKSSDIALCLLSWSSTVVTMNSTVNAVIFFWINNVLRNEGKKLVKKLCLSIRNKLNTVNVGHIC